MLQQLLYDYVALPALNVGFRAVSPWNEKIRTGIQGRKDIWYQIESQLKVARKRACTVWFHFASVGEFEQARPIIEALYDEARIVLTYFSPSVVRNVERYDKVDVHGYLPFDTRRNAAKLMELVQPDMLIFSKFDIWPNYVWAASGSDVPVVLIAGTLHAESRRLSPLGRTFLRRVHQHIALHCVISEDDAERFTHICPLSANIQVTGDTRFDRVYERAQAVPIDERFFPGQETLRRPALVAGSTYREEETVLLEALQQLSNQEDDRPTLILVPHEPTPSRLEEIRLLIGRHGARADYFTELEPGADLSQTEVLVVDTVGILAKLYRLGEVAFVGGSFHGSIHNVMEPAAMARPLIFGPTTHNAYEANLLQRRGAAMMVQNAQELATIWRRWMSDPKDAEQRGAMAKQVIEENLGAAKQTLQAIRHLL